MVDQAATKSKTQKMKQEEFIYIQETKKSFEQAVVDVLKEVDKKGWSLFNVYDVRERLAAKGFQHERLKIIEICSAKYSNNLLNKNKLVSVCMPCKINVIEDNGKINIAGMNPAIITQFFPEVSKDDVVEIENAVKEIIDNAKGG